MQIAVSAVSASSDRAEIVVFPRWAARPLSAVGGLPLSNSTGRHWLRKVTIRHLIFGAEIVTMFCFMVPV